MKTKILLTLGAVALTAITFNANAGGVSWLDALAALVLRPRFAYATVVALVLAGVLLGTYQSARIAKQDARARYLAVVAPNALR